MCVKVKLYGSSRPEVFCRKGVLRNFAKFTGKHLCQSLFFNKVEGLRPLRFWHRYFPMNFSKFLRAPIFAEYLRWVLLIVLARKWTNSANFFLLYLVFFYKHWRFMGQAKRENIFIPLFQFHLLADIHHVLITLHLRWQLRIFNRKACNYQPDTQPIFSKNFPKFSK